MINMLHFGTPRNVNNMKALRLVLHKKHRTYCVAFQGHVKKQNLIIAIRRHVTTLYSFSTHHLESFRVLSKTWSIHLVHLLLHHTLSCCTKTWYFHSWYDNYRKTKCPNISWLINFTASVYFDATWILKSLSRYIF